MSQRLLKSCILLTLMATTTHVFAGPFGWLRPKRCHVPAPTYSVRPPVSPMQTVPPVEWEPQWEAVYCFPSCIDPESEEEMGPIYGDVGYGPDEESACADGEQNARYKAEQMGCEPNESLGYCEPWEGFYGPLRSSAPPRPRPVLDCCYRVTCSVRSCDGTIVNISATHSDYREAKTSACRFALRIARRQHDGAACAWTRCQRVPCNH